MPRSRSIRAPGAAPACAAVRGAARAGRRVLLAPVLLAAVVLPAAGALPARADRVAMTPVQDQAGDPVAVGVVEAAVRSRLEASHELVDPTALRDALRRGRVRRVDDAGADELRALGEETGADWVLTLTLHQSARLTPPRLALSGRAWDTETGALVWAGFEAASGLDGRTVLGLGVIDSLDDLGETVADRLVADLLASVAGGGGRSEALRPSAAGLGAIALVPLGSVTDAAGTRAAETATEVTRALLDRHGAELVSAGCVIGVLRRQPSYTWGGVDAAALEALRATCGARWVVTGQVESFEIGGSEREPEPRVALALRLLDTETGRIVALGGLERRGWDHQSVFRLGRIYTRGQLAERMVETLLRRLLVEAANRRDIERTAP